MKLQILIATYNRAEVLIKNLHILSEFIHEECAGHHVEVLINDNCSSDNTMTLVNDFASKSDINISYERNDTNIGLERNMVKLLGRANAPYIMFLGDDDFIPSDYLAFCLKMVNSNDGIGAIIPGRVSLHEDGSTSGPVRDPSIEIRNAGFESALELSHFGSQLSGLIMKNPKELHDAYINSGYRSIYLFIFWLTYLNINYQTVRAFRYLVKVTTFNAKDWSYTKTGLLEEVFRAYYPFEKSLGRKSLILLIDKFLKMEGWRFGIEVAKPISSIKRLISLLRNTQSIPGLKFSIMIRFIREYIYLLRH